MARTKKIDFDRISFAIIDDNAHTRQLLRTIIRTFGSRHIYEGASGIEGLEILENHSPDILIVDLMMPDLDGLEMVQLIRNPITCKHAFVPIIMLSGYAKKFQIIGARDVGVTEFLCKPISTQHLYDRIESILINPRPFVQNDHYFGPDKRMDPKGRRYNLNKVNSVEEPDAEDDEYEYVKVPADLEQRWNSFVS